MKVVLDRLCPPVEESDRPPALGEGHSPATDVIIRPYRKKKPPLCSVVLSSGRQWNREGILKKRESDACRLSRSKPSSTGLVSPVGVADLSPVSHRHPSISLSLFHFQLQFRAINDYQLAKAQLFIHFFFSNSFSHAINSNWCFHFVAAAAAVVVVVWICCLLSFFAIDFIFLCRHFSFLEGRYRQTDFILFFKRIDLWINYWKIKTHTERERDRKSPGNPINDWSEA